VPDALAKGLRRQVKGELNKSIQARLDSVGLLKRPASGQVELKVETDSEADNEAADPDESASDLIARGDNPECPDCGNMLALQEGCIKCQSCGFSEC
jgi:ribonucleoside-diphosphate reductase alpha chain